VGGIPDQIRDGETGLLIQKPTDRFETAQVLQRVLCDEALGERLGRAAHTRVRDNYLSISALERWSEIVRMLIA
jgi:glycosyltransferase involved in cell wall biosynthesis